MKCKVSTKLKELNLELKLVICKISKILHIKERTHKIYKQLLTKFLQMIIAKKNKEIANKM